MWAQDGAGGGNDWMAVVALVVSVASFAWSVGYSIWKDWVAARRARKTAGLSARTEYVEQFPMPGPQLRLTLTNSLTEAVAVARVEREQRQRATPHILGWRRWEPVGVTPSELRVGGWEVPGRSTQTWTSEDPILDRGALTDAWRFIVHIQGRGSLVAKGPTRGWHRKPAPIR